MILVDTWVWTDHLRTGEPDLVRLLQGLVLAHAWVTGELALGHVSRRSEIPRLRRQLPQAKVATDHEVLTLIDNHQLFGLGIGYVDTYLVAATLLTTGARLWTRDKRLAAVADQLRLVRDAGHEP